jgi:hypothetical protein
MSDPLRTVGRDACERRGYEVTAPGKPWLPPAVAEPTADAVPFVDRAENGVVAVEPVPAADLTPTLLLSRLRNNCGNGRFTLFVVDDDAAATELRGMLREPPLVAAEDDAGRRTFYPGPDRIPLAGGGYAAVRTDSDPASLRWREVGDGDDPVLELRDASASAGGRVLAALDGVAALSCPAAEAFPYAYRRDPDDKRFRVRASDGRSVGVYDGVADMRANAYLPVPMPLVPEHVFSGVDSVRDEWAVLVAADAPPGTAGDR